MRDAGSDGKGKRQVQQRGVSDAVTFFLCTSYSTMSPITRRQKRQERVNYAESSSDASDSEDENFDSSDMSEDDEPATKKKTPTRSNQWAELQRARAQQRRSQWKAAVSKRKKPTIAPRSIKR